MVYIRVTLLCGPSCGFGQICNDIGASQVALVVKSLPADTGDIRVQSLGQADLLEKDMICLAQSLYLAYLRIFPCVSISQPRCFAPKRPMGN